MSQPVTLAAAGWEAVLLPALGGAVATLRRNGRDVLRPTAADADDVLQTASFPLVPYANRIAHGRFRFDGQDIALPRNFGGHPHPLHGVGWRAAWTVLAADSDSASLRLDHAADDRWPWSFVAEQAIGLSANGAAFRLMLRNTDHRPMPAGLGFHPYFPVLPGTRLRASVGGAWLSADDLPVERVTADHFGNWAAGDGVIRPALVDHCHDGWDGHARIEQDGDAIHLDAEGARWLHLYMPSGEPFFCIEPVTHLPDAVNRPGNGVATLAAGEETTIAMRISAA